MATKKIEKLKTAAKKHSKPEKKKAAAKVAKTKKLAAKEVKPAKLEKKLAKAKKSVTKPEPKAAAKLQSPLKIAKRWMKAGVTILLPETVLIGPEVAVAAGVVIEPSVQLLGKTTIGAGTRVRSFTVIEDCVIGANVLIRQSCVLTESTVADGAKIGPFAHLRPESAIGVDAHVGNFCETKKAVIGKGAKVNHLTYIGDAEVGEGTNIGAGTITCNYNGQVKQKTIIGKGAFIGSHSTLIAPVTIGDGAYVGAASCVQKDVPADALIVARAKPIVKEGWAATRRAQAPAVRPTAPAAQAPAVRPTAPAAQEG